MKKLTTFQMNERDRLVRELADSETAVEAAIDAFNAALSDATAALVEVLDKHKDLIDEINQFRDGVANDIADYMAERSEKWQEGEKGEQYRAWESAWQEDFDEVEIDLPEEIEELELDAAQRLKDLPDRPSDAK